MRHGRTRFGSYLRKHAYVLRFRLGQGIVKEVRLFIHAFQRTFIKTTTLRLGFESR